MDTRPGKQPAPSVSAGHPGANVRRAGKRLLGPPYGIAALRHRAAQWSGHGAGYRADRLEWAGDRDERRPGSGLPHPDRNDQRRGRTLDQLFDDLRHLLVAYLQRPLPTLLSDLVDIQDRAFGLLEGRQRPDQTRDLYLVAGITCWLMAVASRDLGATHDAMTQARTGYACADNAGHDGLRASMRGLQSNIAYWTGRWDDAVRYAELGAEPATRSRSTAAVFVVSSEIRALGALGMGKHDPPPPTPDPTRDGSKPGTPVPPPPPPGKHEKK